MHITPRYLAACGIFLGCLACASTLQASESTLEFETRDGLIYVVGDDAPFTGVNEEFYPNGKRWFRIEIKSGVPHGKAEFWYENGNKKSEQRYAGGKIIGIQRKWSESGELLQEIDHQEQ